MTNGQKERNELNKSLMAKYSYSEPTIEETISSIIWCIIFWGCFWSCIRCCLAFWYSVCSFFRVNCRVSFFSIHLFFWCLGSSAIRNCLRLSNLLY